MEFKRVARPKRRLNITPLIDVIFLLIVFFLLTSDFVMLENVQLKVTAVEEVSQENLFLPEETLSILLSEGGKFIFDEQEYKLDQLAYIVRESMGGHVLLKSGDKVLVQDVVTAMDQLKRMEGVTVSIASNQGE